MRDFPDLWPSGMPWPTHSNKGAVMSNTTKPPTKEEMQQLKKDMSEHVAGARAAIQGDAQALREWREKRQQEKINT